MTKKEKMSTKFKHLSEHLETIAAVVVAIGTIGGALVAAGNWIISEVSAQSNQRIDRLQSELEKSNDEHNLAIMRLELMNLIQNDPNNVVEIEKVGRKYFSSGGDWYASGYFSRWCATHSCDASIVLEGKK